MTLREHMEYAAVRARAIFNAQGSIGPMIHAIDANGMHHFALIHMEDKDVAAAAMRDFVQAKNIQQLVYLSEAWILSEPATNSIDMNQLPRPADHPDRTEALIFQGENATESLCAQIEITRNGDQVELGPTDIWASAFSAGRFVNLLGKKEIKH